MVGEPFCELIKAIGRPVLLPQLGKTLSHIGSNAGIPPDARISRANHNGHIACTHGGECLAGLKTAIDQGVVKADEIAIVDSTAHALKFAGFQEMYFERRLPEAFGVKSNPELVNTPVYVHPQDLQPVPAPGKPLTGPDFDRFVRKVSKAIADELSLKTAHKLSGPDRQ